MEDTSIQRHDQVPLDDEFANDVDQRLAVVVLFPHNDAFSEIRSEVEKLVGESAEVVSPPAVDPEIHLSKYQVGPAAEGPFVQYLVTILSDVTPYLNTAAAMITLTGFTKELVKRIRKRLEKGMPHPYSNDWMPGSYFHPILTKPMIQGLCYDHFVNHHGSNAQRVAIDTRVRSTFPMFSSSAHPGGMETYTVRIWTGRRSYIYIVDSKGDAIEHFWIRGRQLVSLALPNWFESEYASDSEPEPPTKPIAVE